MSSRPPSPAEHHHYASYVRRGSRPLSRAELRHAVAVAEGFNAKLAVIITQAVGTMFCAYLFAVLAFVGLPTALGPHGAGIISWIAQTFLQLVLLSIILVGQRVQGIASDARAQRTLADAERILDLLDIHTEGGLTAILNRLDEMSR